MNKIYIKERNGYLAKNIAIFTLGNIGSKIISFFLVPFYTNYLSISEYGVIDLITTICVLMAPIFTMNIEEAVMRFALDNNADIENILSIGMKIVVFGFLIGLLTIPIFGFVTLISEYSFLIYLYAISLGISQFFLCFLRGKELLLKYSIGNILNVFLIAMFNIIFLYRFHWGIKGYVKAYILANLITAIYAYLTGGVWKKHFNYFPDFSLQRNMLKYSIVLIPNTFMWWIINSSDRIMITLIINEGANGIYAISNKFPTLIATFSTIFTKAWSYSAIKESESDDRANYTNDIFNKLFGFMSIVGVGLMGVMRPFLNIYVEKSYYSAWKYTPYLIIGGVFLTMASFLSTTYTVHKDSKGFLFSGLAGAVSNIILNLILIPFIGIDGAALATCISYIVVFVYRCFDIKKYIKLKILKAQNIISAGILVISGVIMLTCSYVIGEIIIVLFFFILLFINQKKIIMFFKSLTGRK